MDIIDKWSFFEYLLKRALANVESAWNKLKPQDKLLPSSHALKSALRITTFLRICLKLRKDAVNFEKACTQLLQVANFLQMTVGLCNAESFNTTQLAEYQTLSKELIKYYLGSKPYDMIDFFQKLLAHGDPAGETLDDDWIPYGLLPCDGD